MKPCRFTILASTGILILCSAGFPLESRAVVQPTVIQTAPDNTAQNKDQGLTADSQPNAQADRVTAQKIRKAIVADKDLSTYGHNVKVIL